MGPFSRALPAPAVLTILAALLVLPGGFGARAAPALAPPVPAVGHGELLAGVHVTGRIAAASGISVSTVTYTSSVDGFPLSYSEVLPAGYLPTTPYPLLVELHGISLPESTPLPGGYPTPLDNGTLNATSAFGFILLAPNTRTGDGFYVDSNFTGPQAQDVLDAIAVERALRSIGPIYLYGFSMGSMGALSLGLQHPNEFAGVGSIATFSDIYELYEYQVAAQATALNGALLNVTGGALPIASSYARREFDGLTELRDHPLATKGLRMYLVSGGEDLLAPDNASLWAYLQANDTVVQTTCLVASAIGELDNCTLPLAALSAADPTNYSYRFVYEPNGVHSDRQLNVTDMLEYFLGELPTGTYVGRFPAPTVRAPPVPLVTLVTQPFDCGTIAWNGTSYPSGNTIAVPPGSFPVAASACPEYRWAGFEGRGGVAYDALTANASVNGEGALIAEFLPTGGTGNGTMRFLLTPTSSDGCPPIVLNGTPGPSGTPVSLPGGAYIAQASACAGWTFEAWSSTGGVRVDSPTDPTSEFTLTANGTLVALYRPSPTGAIVEVFVSPAQCGPIFLNGTSLGNGSTTTLVAGEYAMVAPDCAGFRFAAWSFAGGVSSTTTLAVTTLTIAAAGEVSAIYAPAAGGVPDSLSVSVSPAACGAVISLNGGTYADGSTALLAPGSYRLTALSCPGASFLGWSATGGAAVSSSTLFITGNGSLSASYSLVRGEGGHPSSPGPGASDRSSFVWAAGVAVGIAIGAVAGVLLTRRGLRPPGPPPPE